MGPATLTITGEERSDIACDLLVWSNGYDEVEARRYASETKLKLTDAGATLVIGIAYPDPAQQRATLDIRIPRGFAVRIQPSRGKLEIANVAVAELVDARGQVAVRRVSGRLVATHRGGTLTVETVSALKLNARGSTVVVKDVKGEMAVQMQAGELRGLALAGPVEIESNGTKVVLEDLAGTRRPIRINTVGGTITLAGVRTETRIDGRDTLIDVTIDQPAPVAIYNEGDEPIQVTPPPGSFQFDALATDGRLTVPEGFLEVKSTDTEQRASGAIGGGGPTITLRASRGNIIVRSRHTKR